MIRSLENLNRVASNLIQSGIKAKSHSTSSGSTGLLTYSDLLSVNNKQRCLASLRSTGSVKLKPYWPSGVPLEDMRQAGVLVALCTVKGVPSFLFTLRSKNMTGYSGEVSFAGGMADKEDKDIIETVIREADEEIGIKRSDIDIWGKLLAVPGKGFVTAVTPVLGFCGEIDLSTLKVNPSEVSEVFTCSVESLCDPMNARYTTFRGAMRYSMPVFDGQKHRIWGLTAVLLHNTLQLLAPGLYPSNFQFRRRV